MASQALKKKWRQIESRKDPEASFVYYDPVQDRIFVWYEVPAKGIWNEGVVYLGEL